MSSIPDLPLALLGDLAPIFGLTLTEQPLGFVLGRGGDRYRFIPFEGFMRGSQVREACHLLQIDPYDFVAGHAPGAAHA